MTDCNCKTYGKHGYHEPKCASLKTEIRPVYKRVKVMAAFCPKCNQELRGDNNISMPWWCDCGVWKVNWVTGKYEIERHK